MILPAFPTEGGYGEIRLTGHRIGLEHVILHYRDGFSAEQLHEEYPSLPLGLIGEVLDFYRENRGEVDAYVDRCQEEYERQRRAGHSFDLAELKRRGRAVGLNLPGLNEPD